MAAKKKKMISAKKKTPTKKSPVAAKKKTANKKMMAAPKKAIAAPKKVMPVSSKKIEVKAAPQAKAKAVTSMLTPLDDRIVVSPQPADETTAGGLIIPGTVDSRPTRGTVLAKGRGRRTKKGAFLPLDVNVGDEVLFAEFVGTKITLAGNDVLILREEDLLGSVD
jgi:chaperonin GroES